MQDRQTKTIVQVGRRADQKEKAPGPPKTGRKGDSAGGGGDACMGEKKKDKY
jgi:hypothetical protein